MNLKQIMPPAIKSFAKAYVMPTLDRIELWTGKRDALTPPTRLMYVGDGDYKAIGEHFANRFRDYGGLKPTDHVLDVGSGTGRMAVPLIPYLKQGRYDGLEIVKEGVTWFNDNVHRRHPNFRFHHLDIYNKMYNPRGRVQAAEVRFPFDDNAFDFVLLTSVFTHMLEKDYERYLSEISRVMKKGARGYFTLFLLNAESRGAIAEGRTKYPMLSYTDLTMVADRDVPEYMIAFDEPYVLRTLEAAGLQVEKIHYGGWAGREAYLDYQDTVLVRRK